MITTKYFDFFNQYKIFEATEEEITDIAVNFLFKEIYGKRALASLKSKIKKEKLEEAGITEEEFQGFIDSLKGLSKEQVAEKIASSSTYSTIQEIRDILKNTQLSENQISAAKARAKKDPYFLRLKHLFTKADLPYEWLEAFLRLFYSHFKNYKINPDPTDPEGDYQILTSLLGPYTYSDGQIKWISDYGPYGSFGAIYTKIAKLPGDNNNKAQRDILGKFTTYIKFEKDKQLTSNDANTTGIEMLGDDVRDISITANIDSLIERLPRGYCVDNSNVEIKEGKKKIQDTKTCSLKGGIIKYNLYEEYKTANDSLKEKIKTALKQFIEILDEKGIPIKPVREVVNNKETQVYKYEDIFKIRKGTSNDNYQTDKTIEQFYNRLSQTIKSLLNASTQKLFDNVIAVNNKYGEDKGVEIVYSENNIIVLLIKSHKANHYLHDISYGNLMKTSHCIAYESSGHYDNHMNGNDGPHLNRLYYVYNFNLEPTNPMFPFGLIINPQGKIASSHRRDDQSISHTVKQTTEEYGIPFSVFAPMTQEELEVLRKTQDVQKTIIQKNISLEELKFCIENGADVNSRNGVPLKNAVSEKSIEKITYLFDHGVNIKLLEKAELKKLVEISIPINTNDIPSKIALIKNILNADSTFEEYAMFNAVTEWSLKNNNFDFFNSIADYYNASSFNTEEFKKELTHMIDIFGEFNGKIDKQFLNWLANRIKLFSGNNDVRLNKFKKYLMTHFDNDDLTYINKLL